MILKDIIFNYESKYKSKSAYYNFDLILTKIENPLPEPKTVKVDINGMDGSLDLSTALTGDIQYNNRKIKMYFTIADIRDYDKKISEIANYLHGKNITFINSNDDLYFYKGLATISKWECSKGIGSIVIDVDAYPFKIAIHKTSKTFTVNLIDSIYVECNSRKRVVPDIEILSGSMTLMKNNFTTEELTVGKYTIPEIYLIQGDNYIACNGSGTVKFTWKCEVL